MTGGGYISVGIPAAYGCDPAGEITKLGEGLTKL